MDPEANKKEIFVYLDFDGKLPTEFSKSKMFIRIADLQTKNPLVQVNDMVFKGTYERSIGTNMFFTKSQTDDIADNPFQPVSGCSLELLNLQTKVLNCKQMRVLSENREMPQKNNKIQYNFNWDYNELLKKFEDGTLDLKDMISKDEYSEDEKQESEIENEEIEDTVVDKLNEEHTSEELAIKPDEIEKNRLRHAYENLMMLARKPLQRKQIVENVECIEGYSKSFNFKNIECKVLERPFFSYFKNKDKIDIDRCVQFGLLNPSDDIPRSLTEEEEKRIFKIENMEFLNLEARYSIFVSYVDQLEKEIMLNTAEKNAAKDIYGNTPLETLNILKKLVCSLENRIQEIKSAA